MRWAFCLLALVGVLVGCEFNPEGVNYQQRTIPDFSSVDLTGFSEEDTIFVWTPTNFLVSVENLGARKVLKAEATVDGNPESVSIAGNQVSLTINPYEFSDGVHILEVKLTMTTASNSLADMMQIEAIEVRRSWKFEVSNSPPGKVSFTNYIVEDEALKISWEKYTKSNFAFYRFSRNCCWIDSVKDRNRTWYVDTTYVGGSRTFGIAVVDGAGRNSSVTQQVYTDGGMNLTVTHLINGSRVKWNMNKYTRAFKNYWVTTPSQNWPYFMVVHSTSNRADTTFDVSAVGTQLGHVKTFTVYTTGHAFNMAAPTDLNLYPNKTVETYQGRKVLNHEIWEYIKATENLYTTYNSSTLRLNAQTLDTLASVNISYRGINVSNNAAYAYYSDGFTVRKLDPQTLSLLNSYPTAALTGQTRPFGIVNISDTNLMCGTTSDGKSWLIDMNTLTVLFSGPLYEYPMVSPDSKYFFDGAKLYKNTAGVLTLLFNYTGLNYKLLFSASFPDKAFLIKSLEIQLINLPSGSNVRQIPVLYFPSQVSIDEKTNLIIAGGGNEAAVYNPNSGTVHLDIGHTNSGFYALFNGKLYRNGYVINVDDYHP